MTPSRLWLQIFIAGFAVIAALLAVTLATPVPYGDLSRIGRISDGEFGWHRPAPQVDPAYLRSWAPSDAEILVIGDSFSMTGRWQSALVRSGYTVSTIFWNHFGNALCDDFEAWLAQSGFKGKLVIVESTERLLNERLTASAQCRTAKIAMRTNAVEFLPPPEIPPRSMLNWSAKLTTGWISYFNTRRAKSSNDVFDAGKNAIVRPVPDGCALFSHQLCDKALFFGDDEDNGELTPKDVAIMQAFNKAHASIPIVWTVIPNKTTVYVEPDHSKDFAASFRQSGLGPDLFGFATEEKTQIQDFFFPNDTHLSMHGQLALGQRMLEVVRKFVPQPSARAS